MGKEKKSRRGLGSMVSLGGQNEEISHLTQSGDSSAIHFRFTLGQQKLRLR